MRPGEHYGFAETLPVEPISAGSTVLVAGPALSGAGELALSMVAGGTDSGDPTRGPDDRSGGDGVTGSPDGTGGGDGMLFISTNMTYEKLLDACDRSHPAFDSSRAGVIDCTGQDPGQSRFDARVKYISTQSDLTGIGMKFSALYEALYAASGGGRVRTGLVSLSSLAMYVDMRALYQFTQTLSGRIDSADGLGVFTVDPTTHDTATVNTLSQAADGRIEVREAEDGDADGELRVRGLPDQPDGWQPFSLS